MQNDLFVSHRKFGKLAPANHDFKGMALTSEVLRSILPEAPANAGWVDPKLYWPMFLNDKLGCCTATAKALLALVWTRWAQGELIWADSAVLSLYEQTGHYVPGQPATDGGAIMANVNAFMCQGLDIGTGTPEVWTVQNPIDHTNLDDIARAIKIFRAVDCGWVLSQAMANSTDGTWKVVPGSPLVGGHDAIVTGVKTVGSARRWQVLTWSETFEADDATLRTYLDEARIGASRQHMLNIHGATPMGDTMDQLVKYSAALQAA